MRELPVFDVYSHSIRSIRDNLGFAFQISWPWMLALLPFNIAAHIYLTLHPMSDFQNHSVGILAVTWGMGLLTMVVFASIAVMWHRYVLIGEVPTGLARFRLDATVWRYVGNTILIVLIFVAGGIAAAIIFAICGAISKVLGAIVAVLGGLALIAAFISYAMRFGIKLPFVAVGDRNYSFGDALRDSEGNFWRFIGLSLLIVLTAICIALVLAAVTYVISQANLEPLLYVSIALQFFLNWVLTVWNVTVLTTLYAFFAQGQQV